MQPRNLDPGKSADPNILASSPGRRLLGRADTLQDFTSATTDKYYKLARTFSKATRDATNAEISLGPWAAAAEASSKILTLGEIRGGPFVEFGWPGDILSPVSHRLRGVSLSIESSPQKAHAAPAIQRVMIRYAL